MQAMQEMHSTSSGSSLNFTPMGQARWQAPHLVHRESSSRSFTNLARPNRA
jgi:hypothetical protein